MSETVIKVENLSKRYRLGELHKHTNSFREKVTNAFSRKAQSAKRKVPNPMRSAPSSLRSSQSDDHLWALRNVSFEVKRGEVLGIIGRNGAGKTTLLKILSRITSPTEGTARIDGRVGSLLEVGTGFHPELTGRENIFLNGAILGMTKTEIRQKFDEIVDFAEIEKFIDTPVKRYSSGMYVRLAFAVASHLDPEILLIDEVLAVGDLSFQKKCLGKIDDISSKGRTILFVSHNMSAVQSLCSKTLLLSDGHTVSFGKTQKIIQKYLNQSIEKPEKTSVNMKKLSTQKHGKVIRKILLYDNANKPRKVFPIGSDLNISLEIEAIKPIDNVNIGLGIRSDQGYIVAITEINSSFSLTQGKNVLVGKLPNIMLSSGTYFITVDLRSHLKNFIDRIEDAIKFVVQPIDLWKSGWQPPTQRRSWICSVIWHIESK